MRRRSFAQSEEHAVAPKPVARNTAEEVRDHLEQLRGELV
jgi:hypothetical protein